MVTRKRLSLSEIAEEENEAVDMHGSENIKQKLGLRPVQKKHNAKNDFVKMSITVDPESFERLLDISRERRKVRQPHTMSDIVRTALKHWLETNKSCEMG